MTSLSFSVKKKQQNVLLVNGYMQIESTNVSMKDAFDHINPIQLHHITIQKNYTELKKMFTPNPLLIKSIPFCLYNFPIWHINTSNDTPIFYTKLIINQWICMIVVKPCVFDFVRFEKYKSPVRSLYTDYNMGIIINEDDAYNILEYGYTSEKNPIDM